MRAVEGEGARGFGKGLVVVDEHAHPADRGVEGGELVARGVGQVLTGGLVHFAVAAEDAVAGQADRRVLTSPRP